jgi:hypothetical protein
MFGCPNDWRRVATVTIVTQPSSSPPSPSLPQLSSGYDQWVLTLYQPNEAADSARAADFRKLVIDPH